MRSGAAAALACALAACGGSGASPFTPTQGATLAREVNLRASDVPGFIGSPNPYTATDRAQDRALAACAGGVSPDRALVIINSPSFAVGAGTRTQTIGSSVIVLPSSALVEQDVGSLRSTRGQACLTRSLDAALEQGSGPASFSRFRISMLSVPMAGTMATFALRLYTVLSAGGRHFAYYTDALGAGIGHGEISLFATSLSRPVPTATEQRLFALLVRRANATAH